MEPEFNRNYFPRNVVPFMALLVLAMTASVLAQTSGTNPTDKSVRLFRPAVTYDSGGEQASSVAVADLNGDGKPDLVVTNCGSCYGPPRIGHSGSVGVLLGNGDGTFQTAVTYGSGGEVPVSVAIADVNGDRKPDLVVVNRNSNNIGILLGNGDGTFQPAVTYGSPSPFFSPLLVVVGDLNGDGKADLVVASQCGDENCDGAVGVLLNNGDGTFQPAALYSSGGAYGAAVAIADVNGDGRADVLVANGESGPGVMVGNVGVLLGNGDGTLQPAVAYTAAGVSLPPASSLLAVADVSGNGKPDIVVESSQCCDSADGVVGVLLNNGNGTFQPVVPYPSGKGGWGTSVAVGDLNQDGHPDIVATDGCSFANCAFDGVVAILLGNDDGTFQAALDYSTGGFLANSVAVADVNGDGKPDLVVANMCSDGTYYCRHSSVGVLLNNTGTTKTVVTTSGSPSFVGQPVTFTATVTSEYGRIPDGEPVTFYDGSLKMRSVALAGGKAAYTTSSLSAKAHTIKATYLGDAIYKASSGSVKQLVNKYATTTALSSNLNPSQPRQAVTFAASVTVSGPSSPTGKVTFMDGTLKIGSSTLNRGVATLTTSKLAMGSHAITAKYPGDFSALESTSTVLDQGVQ